jgi:ribose transport system substrate-binding protein
MKILKIISAIGFVGFCLFNLGCQDVTDELVGKKPDGFKEIHITMIAKSGTNPVFHSAKIGAEAAAKELSEKYSMIDVVIDWRTPEIDDPSEQLEKIRNAVKDGTDAILVSCSDEDSLAFAINEAVNDSIPVMTFDSDAPDSKRFSFYGPDDVEIGENLMDELAELIGGNGQVAILGGIQEAPNLQKRVKGVNKAAAKYSGIEIVGEFYHAESADSATAEVLRVNNEYPNLKGWAMVGGWPLFEETLLNKIEPGKIKIVAVDALPVQLIYIEKGAVQALLGQPTFKWGKISVENIIKKLHLKEEVPENIKMKTIRVSIENLGGWARQLRAWGYDGIPEKYLIM